MSTGGDFLRVSDYSAERLVAVVESAVGLESQFASRAVVPVLDGYRLAFWWDGAGFRNRVAFELGARLLGAVGIEVPGSVGHGEEIADVAAYLENWFDAVVVRTPELASLSTLAEATSSTVINARTTHNHPCEILGDLAFLHTSTVHRLGDPLHLVFVGPATNLLRSWVEAAVVLPITVTQVCPPGYELRDPAASVGTVTTPGDLETAVGEADVVYTDCWPADLDGTGRLQFDALRVTARLLDRCNSDAVFLPCPPVTRGHEVSADAMSHARCRVVEAKRWLLHAQNALLVQALVDE